MMAERKGEGSRAGFYMEVVTAKNQAQHLPQVAVKSIPLGQSSRAISSLDPREAPWLVACLSSETWGSMFTRWNTLVSRGGE